jgi:catechol 2,3-dioxygenase-like lactoylglutathione lyase family enzyme
MNFHHVGLAIFDEKEVTAFYETVLEMKCERQTRLDPSLAEQVFNLKPAPINVYLMTRGNITLELFVSPETVPGAIGHICMRVQQRDMLVQRARQNGYQVDTIARDHGNLIFVFDRQMNRFEIKPSGPN